MHNHVQASLIRRRPSAVRAVAALLGLVLLGATACGGSAEVGTTADEASNTASTQADTDTSSTQPAESEPAETEPETLETESASSPQIGQGTFELVLENGETYAAPVRCVLDPQIAAGSEILFTAAGQDDDRFYDVTQWGETGFGGTQDVEVADTTSFDTLWRSTGSTGLVLELNGNVITGSGGFYQGEAINGPYTQGELTVSC